MLCELTMFAWHEEILYVNLQHYSLTRNINMRQYIYAMTGITKNSGEFQRILKNSKESERIRKNPDELKRILENPGESGRIQEHPRESGRIL